MARPVAAVIEDLEFLDGENVGAFEAARRTNFPSAEAMEKWLERHDAYDLWLAFKARDPEGAHSQESRRAAKVSARSESIGANPIGALLDEAEASAVAKHRRKAERIRALLAELKSLLDADRERREAEAEARSEIERLQAELAEAKARLKNAGTAAPSAAPSGPTASEVRAWANTNNVACPKAGRVPNAVIEAYMAATRDGAA